MSNASTLGDVSPELLEVVERAQRAISRCVRRSVK